ncbi:MAG: exodeoxyribonuclease VII large subunit [Eubacteriales bacterium]|nr:exodeoxyribonuclease VII large subunit [Eubacteriales bacterium]
MVLSVSELNEYVRKSLASDPIIQHISIKGEISNFKSYSSGHWYFTLKDDNAAISCVMFRQYNYIVDFIVEDGMAVELVGNVSLYSKTGQYQFYVENIIQSGVGLLFKKFEELKDKLFKEGLFDESIKKPLPLFAKKIGVISSRSGAVIHDIINVTLSRNNLVSILLYPSKVQGSGTAKNVIDGIDYFNKLKNVDVIIVARGGGSFEDLYEFNDESLARKVRSSEIPIISAVGHETDFTILDFVSDKRAATPSHAAEIAVVKYDALINLIEQLYNKADYYLNDRTTKYKSRINTCGVDLKNFGKIFDLYRSRISNLEYNLSNNLKNIVMKNLNNVKLLEAKLDLLNPSYILEKGYTIITKDNKVVSSANAISIGDSLNIKLKDGAIESSVNEVYYGKEKANI